MSLWDRRHVAGRAEQYPAEIAGSLLLRTGDRVPLIATLLDGVDEQGCRRYLLRPEHGDRLPITEAEYLAGGYSIQIDLVPGRSSMTFGFRQEDAP